MRSFLTHLMFYIFRLSINYLKILKLREMQFKNQNNSMKKQKIQEFLTSTRRLFGISCLFRFDYFYVPNVIKF